MTKVQMNSISNYNYNSYLSKCDLINKYNLTTAFETPKLDKIVLDFPIKELINALDKTGKSETDSDIQLKAFLVLYIINLFFPYVTFNKLELTNSNKTKIASLSGSLKIVFSQPEEINLFLSSFFVENWNRMLDDDFTLFDSLNNTSTKLKLSKNFIHTTKISGNSFFETSDFFAKNLSDVNPKELNIYVNFFFSNLISNANTKSSIENIPLFWISG